MIYLMSSSWCGGCKAAKAILPDVATELNEDCQVIDVDTDSGSELAKKYSVRGIPLFIRVNEYGEELGRSGSGSVPQVMVRLTW